MSHLAEVSAAVGALLPIVIAVIQQMQWSSRLKSVVALGICVAAAAITAWIEGKVDLHNLSVSLAYIYTLAMVSYHSFWKPTGVSSEVEAKTTLTSSPA